MFTEELLTVLLISKEDIYQLVVSDEFVETTVNAILKSAYSGEVGDGKIFVFPADEAYRIRTKETGNKSLN